MERYMEQTKTIPSSLPQIVKPLAKINNILATFPYKEIKNDNGQIQLSSKTFQYYRTLFTLGLLSFTVFSSTYGAMRVLLSPRAFDASGYPIPILNKIVELLCGTYANFITCVIIVLALLKKKILIEFLNQMESYAVTLSRYMDKEAVHQMTKKMYMLYGILGVLASVSVGIRYFQIPENGPLYIFLQLINLESQVAPDILAFASGCLVFYLSICKFALIAYVEVVCVALSTCFCRCIENIQEYVEDQLEIWKRFQQKEISSTLDKDDFLNLFPATENNHSPQPSAPPLSNKQTKFHNELESYIDEIRELNPGLISASVNYKGQPTLSANSTKRNSFLKQTPGKVLCHALRKFQHVATIQHLASTVFGHILAVNVGCTVAMSVILKYLIITQVTSHLRESTIALVPDQPFITNLTFHDVINSGYDDGNNDTESNVTTPTSTPPSWAMNITDLNTSNTSENVPMSTFYSDSFEWVMFLGLDISMCIRLGVTIIYLGNVHRTSLQFNSLMGKAFLRANRLCEQIASALGTEGDDLSKALMTPTQTSSIIAFMNLYNTNPLAFTAGGLFTFSRGLLLMVISVITSYLVFLLQA